ncbi:putative HAD superfamily hydrolase [Microthyrium microscopicum]|uniref:Putative HAD superfamily hydrolase n=1 Tax=Microthyrium microscopicum TaxID=703497 RepID=A0A6A6U6A3_9PEZI|nr:putative HAD superfamily hydrolase [Microthyrium microscopicum]
MAQSNLTPTGLPKIRACLFDMDGLLIDSEDIYTFCTNEVLAQFGKPPLPWDVKARLQGRPGPEASEMLQAWAQLPISMDEFKKRTQELQTKHFPSTQPLPGALDLLTRLAKAREQGKVKMAVATSSHRLNFESKTGHLGHLIDIFQKEHVVVGDDPRIPKGRGKPAPDIYLLALSTLNEGVPKDQQIHPEECLVFEDSVPGVEAGRRAGMQVAWVPHEGLFGVYGPRKHEVLAGLTGEHKEVDSEEARAETVEMERLRGEWVDAGRGFARVRGRPGEVDDGWGRLYKNLVDFPLDSYGI